MLKSLSLSFSPHMDQFKLTLLWPRTFIFIPFFLSLPYRGMTFTDVLSLTLSTSLSLPPHPTPLPCTLLTWFFCLVPRSVPVYTYRAFHLENISFYLTYRSIGREDFCIFFPPLFFSVFFSSSNQRHRDG